MKFLLATTKGGEEDKISPVFGRCATFTIVNADGGKIQNVTVETNPHASGAGGVGIQVAQYAVDQKVNAVFAGQFGPNATDVLKAAGIDMVAITGVSVKEAVLGYMKGDLKPAASVAGGGAPGARGFPAAPPVGAGVGCGRGGRGMGRGGGRGGGRGMGMGLGRGYGHGLCRWQAWSLPPHPAYPYGTGASYPPELTNMTDGPTTDELTVERELEYLKYEAEKMETHLDNIRKRIKTLGGKTKAGSKAKNGR